MSNPESGSALMRVLATLVGMGQTRLELAGVELAQARQMSIRVVVLAVLAALLLVVGSVFASAALVYLLWGTNPVFALLLVGFAYGGAGYVCLNKVKQGIDSFPPLFEATVAELGKDKIAVQEAVATFANQSKQEGRTP